MGLEVCSCGADSVIVLNFKGYCKKCFCRETGCNDPAFYSHCRTKNSKTKSQQNKKDAYKAKLKRTIKRSIK